MAGSYTFRASDIRPVVPDDVHCDCSNSEVRDCPPYARLVAIAQNVRRAYLPLQRAPHARPCARGRPPDWYWGLGKVVEAHAVFGAMRDAINRLGAALEPFKTARENLVAKFLAHERAQQAYELATTHGDGQDIARAGIVRDSARSFLLRAQRAAQPLHSALPRRTRKLMFAEDCNASKNNRSGTSGAYTLTARKWEGDSQCGLATVQRYNTLRLTRRFLQSGAVHSTDGIDGLAQILLGVEGFFENEEVMMLELVLHDSPGHLMASFFWHRDDTAAEAGQSESGQMCRTVLLCLDKGCVDLEVAGFDPVAYHTLPEFPYVFVSMAPDVFHQSKHVERPPCAGVVQRKLVLHMRQRVPGKPRVDWLAMAGAGR